MCAVLSPLDIYFAFVHYTLYIVLSLETFSLYEYNFYLTCLGCIALFCCNRPVVLSHNMVFSGSQYYPSSYE